MSPQSDSSETVESFSLLPSMNIGGKFESSPHLATSPQPQRDDDRLGGAIAQKVRYKSSSGSDGGENLECVADYPVGVEGEGEH